MGNINTIFKVPDNLKAINVIKFEDWLQLTTFADHAITFNATNETQLRILANMQPSDPIPDDVKITVNLYSNLGKACEVWINTIVPGANEVARDVMRHSQDCNGLYKLVESTIQGVFPDASLSEAKSRLSEQWKSGNPSEKAIHARTSIARSICRLKGEAERRGKKAKELHCEMIKFKGDLADCENKLVQQTKGYTDNYGAESEQIKQLHGQVADLNKELTSLRKKETDEVIVLETTPLYLLIPWPFGAIIMGGVLTGVGVDLDQVRNRIKNLTNDLVKASATLKTDEAFLQYHQWAKKATEDSGKRVLNTMEALGHISTAWDLISSDLKDFERLLNNTSTDALAGDWEFAQIDLQSAQCEWERLAGEAQGYLENQLQTGGTEDIDTAMQGIKLKVA